MRKRLSSFFNSRDTPSAGTRAGNLGWGAEWSPSSKGKGSGSCCSTWVNINHGNGWDPQKVLREVPTEPLSIIPMLQGYLGTAGSQMRQEGLEEDSGSSRTVRLSSGPGKVMEQIILGARKSWDQSQPVWVCPRLGLPDHPDLLIAQG